MAERALRAQPSEAEVEQRVNRLLDVVAGSRSVLVCTHDNPDPDSIASAFALGRLLEARAGLRWAMAHGGVLGRAENRAMVRLLKIPLVPMSRIDIDDYDVMGLVDTQPESGNHRLHDDMWHGKKRVCIDHHPARPSSADLDFADVGGPYGATSTVLTTYLESAGVPIDRALATALFYGIKSDTRDLGREVGDDDVWAYSHLVGLTDMSIVSQIEHPRLPREYFAVLVRAVQRAACYESVVTCDLGEVYVPDLVPETADWLLHAEGIKWSIVVGEHGGDVYASLRVSDRRCSAGKLVREVIADYPHGSAGGHGSMAGARIPLPKNASRAARTRARRQLLKKLVGAAGVSTSRPPTPLTILPHPDGDSEHSVA